MFLQYHISYFTKLDGYFRFTPNTPAWWWFVPHSPLQVEPERTRLWNYADRVDWKKQVGYSTIPPCRAVLFVTSYRASLRVHIYRMSACADLMTTSA